MVFMVEALMVANFAEAIFVTMIFWPGEIFGAADFGSVVSSVAIIQAIMDMELAT